VTTAEDYVWYKLFRAEGFGPRSLAILHQTARDRGVPLAEVFAMDEPTFASTFPALGRGRLKRASFRALKELDEDTLFREYEQLQDSSIALIHADHEQYPGRLLRFIDRGVPLILFCRGNVSLLKHGGVAIVGSRDASDEALQVSRRLANDLALKDQNVISGYAKGVDTSAHLGALEADGTTSIVLSSGILRFSRKKAFNRFRGHADTLVLSQFAPKAGWSARNAMIRNRLVCALSRAVIGVESGGERGSDLRLSGTFNTGKTALDMGIPVFVVSPVSLGSAPAGNTELIILGAVEIEPRDGVEVVLSQLNADVSDLAQPRATAEQRSFFDEAEGNG